MEEQTPQEEAPEREQTIDDLDVPEEQADDVTGGVLPPNESPNK